VLTVALGALALAPSAGASTGAVDQYTEQPPTTPAGDGHDLSTGGAAAGGGSPSGGAPGVLPSSSEPPAPADDFASGGSAAGGAESAAGRLGISDWPWREIAIGAAAALTGPDPGHPAVPESGSYGGDDPALPLLDYPVTPLILVLMSVALGGLVLAGGLGAYRRLRGPAGGTA